MKIALVLAVASLGLAGCGSVDFFGDSGSTQAQSSSSPDASQNVAAAPAPAVSPAPPSQMASTQAETSDMSAGQTASTATVTQASASPSAHCTALAKQRAIDAAFQGEDPDTQEAVYNRTYSDCVAWDLKHAFR